MKPRTVSNCIIRVFGVVTAIVWAVAGFWTALVVFVLFIGGAIAGIGFEEESW